jgi:hypothetical protein
MPGSKLVRAVVLLGACAGLAVATAPAAVAQNAATCIKKGGEGTGGSKESAMFQAWEIILQTTDFMGVWSPWMASSQKVGVAPGYTVSNMSSKCTQGQGLGHTCKIFATLCKK